MATMFCSLLTQGLLVLGLAEMFGSDLAGPTVMQVKTFMLNTLL